MSIAFSCEHCGRKYVVADNLAGKQIRCKDCGKTIPVRAESDDTSALSGTGTGTSLSGTQVTEVDGTRAPVGGTRTPAAGGTRAPSSGSTGTRPVSRLVPRGPAKPQNGVSPEKAVKSPAPNSALIYYYRFLDLFKKIGWIKGGAIVILFSVWYFWPYLRTGYGDLADRFGWNKITFGTAADLAKVPAPAKFPSMGLLQPDPSGAGWCEIKINAGDAPGQTMQLRIYMPPGDHVEKSLPCVLMAASRSSLLAGAAPNEEDSAELLAYAQKGFVAVCYSMDGALPRGTRDFDSAETAAAVKQFMLAKAGMVNARNALSYALTKIREVDPNQVYCVGSGPAATVALTFAALEGRIKGCAIYAGVYDIPKAQDAQIKSIMKRLATAPQFFADASPTAHLADFTCPVYLFHAEDDPVRSARETRAFVESLRKSGKRMQSMLVPKGGHREAIMSLGIPSAIRWLTAVPTHGNAVQVAGSAAPEESIYHEITQPTPWPLDAEGDKLLDAEVSVGAYKVRPPKGMRLSLASEDPKTLLEWNKPTGPAPGAFSIRIVPRKNDRQKLPWLATAAADPEKAAELFTITVSDDVLVDRGAINGLTFTRVTRYEGTDKRVERAQYVAADDEVWISVLASSDEQSAMMQALHAAVRTIKKAEPYVDPYAPAAVAPRLADDPAHAAAILRKLGSAAEPAVIAQLKNASPAVRKLAADILKDIGTAASLAALGEAARDSAPEVAAAAREAWRKLDPKTLDVVGEAILDLSGNDRNRKVKAVEALAFAPVDERKELIAGFLGALALSDDDQLRAATNKALPIWKIDKTGADLITHLTPNGDAVPRRRAIDALIQLKDKRALAPAIACIPYEPEAVNLLAVIGGEKDIADLLSGKLAPAIRAAACKVLGEYGTISSLKTLATATRDPDAKVAAAAKAALTNGAKIARTANPQWTVDEPLVRDEIVIAPPADAAILDQLTPPVTVMGYSIRAPKILRAARLSNDEERKWDRPKPDMSPGAELTISVRRKVNKDLTEPRVVAGIEDKAINDAVFARNGVVEYAVIDGWKMLRVTQDVSTAGVVLKRIVYAAFDGDKMVEVAIKCVNESEETLKILEEAAHTMTRPKR